MNANLKFMKAPSVIFRLPIRSQLGRMVLFTLASMETTGTQPSQSLLAYITNSTNTTISAILNALEDEGWLMILVGKNKKQKETNTYKINWNKIEEHTTDKDYLFSNKENPQPKEESVSKVKETVKNEVVENKFNWDVKESATLMLNLVKLKTPKDKIDDVFKEQISSISMKYCKRLDYVAQEIIKKTKELMSAA